MGKVTNFLSGVRILEETTSVINGKITVIKSLAFGTYIQVSGLTQSGGIIKNIWNTVLRKVKANKLEVAKTLVLGLGGGSIVRVVNNYWPNTKITAVDVDPIMVELGIKYLDLNKESVNLVIDDAEEFLKKNSNRKKPEKFDLILVDLYVGDEYPKKFETENYMRMVRTVLNTGGLAVINRLYYGEKRPQAVKFGGLLEKIFSKVEVVYPEANLMYILYR